MAPRGGQGVFERLRQVPRATCGMMLAHLGVAVFIFAVTLLKRHPIKDSIRGKMIRCGLNTEFLTEVLTHKRV